MIEEDRKLLLLDLSARLPHRIFLKIGEYSDYALYGIVQSNVNKPLIVRCDGSDFECSLEVVKPYLRPLSSMTENEKRHISKMMCLRTYDDGVVHDMNYPVYTPYYVMDDCLSYLRSIHVDYSGLIEKGLALEATEGMYV